MAPCWPHLVAFLLPSVRVLRMETLTQDTRDWLQTSSPSPQAATQGHGTRLWGASSGGSSCQEKHVYYHLIWVEKCVVIDLAALWGFGMFPPFLYTFSMDCICCKTHTHTLYMDKKQNSFNV